MRTKARNMLFVSFVVLVFSGCTQVAPEQPTQEPTDTFAYDFEIIFDGQQCFVGVYDVSIGAKDILFTNTSGKDAFPYICRLDPDRSWQDPVEYSGAPGSWRREALWCHDQGRTRIGMDEESEIYRVAYLAEGEYMILCDQTEEPAGGWLGVGFWIH